MTSPDPTQPQTPQDPPGPRRLTRSSSDQVLGGVAGGLGRYFDIDPILFRIGFGVAALAGGAGLIAYLALWLLVADDRGAGAKRPDTGKLALIIGGGILVLVLVGLLPGPDLFIWPGFLGLLVLGILVVAIVSGDPGGDTRSRLGRAVIVTLAVVAAAFAGLFAAVGTAFGGGAVVAGLVIALGLALVAGAFGRGRRWLLVPALVLATPAALVQAADLRVEGGVGEREYRPASVTEIRDTYRLGAGEMVIDLSGVDFPAGRTPLAVDMGFGGVEIIVPEDVCVSSEIEIGAGVAEVFGHENGDIGVDWTQRPRAATAASELAVDAEIDVGAIIVRRPSGDGWDDGHDPFHDLDDEDDATGPVAQVACGA